MTAESVRDRVAPPAPDDPELVAKLQRGDTDALGDLFDRYSDRIYNYCYLRTGSWDVAQDATSTAFLEAWRARANLHVHNDLALPWLYGVANNVCRNLTRANRRHLAAVGRLSDPGSVADHADDVVAQLDDERQLRAVLAAVRNLSEVDQGVVSLVLGAQLSYEEAAAALKIPVGTVRSRLFRARRRLKQQFPQLADQFDADASDREGDWR